MSKRVSEMHEVRAFTFYLINYGCTVFRQLLRRFVCDKDTIKL
jgi:hypothetical protein